MRTKKHDSQLYRATSNQLPLVSGLASGVEDLELCGRRGECEHLPNQIINTLKVFN